MERKGAKGHIHTEHSLTHYESVSGKANGDAVEGESAHNEESADGTQRLKAITGSDGPEK